MSDFVIDRSKTGAKTSEDIDSKQIIADGGIDERRDLRNKRVQQTDELVRRYSIVGDVLHAYRSDDGEHHYVISRGSDPGTHWEKAIPAEVEHPVPGQKRWTIPDNWQRRISSSRDNICYAIYYIPETDLWAKVAESTNDHLVDAFYLVETVGDLDIDPVGNLGSRYEILKFAEEYRDRYSGEDVEEDVEAIRNIADNWHVVEEDLEMMTEWIQDEKLAEDWRKGVCVSADRNWQIEFAQRIFRPENVISDVVDFSDYDISLSTILDELRDEDLIPDYYRCEISIDSSDIGMEHHIRRLIEAGASPASALDYYMVEKKGVNQDEWANERGIEQPSVHGNIRAAKDVVDSS